MNTYKIKFEFTTVRGSMFTGRAGETCINTELNLDEIDYTDEELLGVCANAIYSLKPKWKIFMVTIKSITQLNLIPNETKA